MLEHLIALVCCIAVLLLTLAGCTRNARLLPDRRKTIPNAFWGAHLGPWGLGWSTWQRVVVPSLYNRYRNLQSEALRLRPNAFDISGAPLLVKKLFSRSDKGHFYNTFSHVSDQKTLFEETSLRDAQNFKRAAGAFLNPASNYGQLCRYTFDACEKVRVSIRFGLETKAYVELYDLLGLIPVEVVLRHLLGDAYAPRLLPLDQRWEDQGWTGRDCMHEIYSIYQDLPSMQLWRWLSDMFSFVARWRSHGSESGQCPVSPVDQTCVQRCERAIRTREQQPKIVQELSKAWAEEKEGSLDEEAIAEVATRAGIEIADNAFAAHLCSISILHALQNLARHPSWQEEIHRDLIGAEQYAGRSDESSLKNSVLKACRPLQAVIWETFRHSPPVAGLQHRIVNDTRALQESGLEHLIMPGDEVTGSAYILNRNERTWRDPDRWDPSRWMGEGISAKKSEVYTFSSGSRSCGGQKLAEYLCPAVCAYLVLHYRFYPPEGHHASLSAADSCGGYIAYPYVAADGSVPGLILERRT